jgi:hypothetical protein
VKSILVNESSALELEKQLNPNIFFAWEILSAVSPFQSVMNVLNRLHITGPASSNLLNGLETMITRCHPGMILLLTSKHIGKGVTGGFLPEPMKQNAQAACGVV